MNIFDIKCVDCDFVDYSDADFTKDQRDNFRCQWCERELFKRNKKIITESVDEKLPSQTS